MGFQTQVYYNLAPGVEGDFASRNPYANVLAGPGGLVAGSQGLTVGRFAGFRTSTLTPTRPRPRSQLRLWPGCWFCSSRTAGAYYVYLAESSMLVPSGFPVTLMKAGDFWVKNAGSTQAVRGQKAYASFVDGTVTFAATGSASNGFPSRRQLPLRRSLQRARFPVTSLLLRLFLPARSFPALPFPARRLPPAPRS